MFKRLLLKRFQMFEINENNTRKFNNKTFKKINVEPRNAHNIR